MPFIVTHGDGPLGVDQAGNALMGGIQAGFDMRQGERRTDLAEQAQADSMAVAQERLGLMKEQDQREQEAHDLAVANEEERSANEDVFNRADLYVSQQQQGGVAKERTHQSIDMMSDLTPQQRDQLHQGVDSDSLIETDQRMTDEGQAELELFLSAHEDKFTPDELKGLQNDIGAVTNYAQVHGLREKMHGIVKGVEDVQVHHALVAENGRLSNLIRTSPQFFESSQELARDMKGFSTEEQNLWMSGITGETPMATVLANKTLRAKYIANQNAKAVEERRAAEELLRQLGGVGQNDPVPGPNAAGPPGPIPAPQGEPLSDPDAEAIRGARRKRADEIGEEAIDDKASWVPFSEPDNAEMMEGKKVATRRIKEIDADVKENGLPTEYATKEDRQKFYQGLYSAWPSMEKELEKKGNKKTLRDLVSARAKDAGYSLEGEVMEHTVAVLAYDQDEFDDFIGKFRDGDDPRERYQEFLDAVTSEDEARVRKAAGAAKRRERKDLRRYRSGATPRPSSGFVPAGVDQVNE